MRSMAILGLFILPMPFIPPMLCSRLERLTERRYIAEPKLDGQRAQVHISKGRRDSPAAQSIWSMEEIAAPSCERES